GILGRGTTYREAACSKEPVSEGSCNNIWRADDTKPKPETAAGAIRHVGSRNNRLEAARGQQLPGAAPVGWTERAARRPCLDGKKESPPQRLEYCLFS